MQERDHGATGRARRRTLRTVVTACTLAAVVVGAASCSSDSKSSDTTGAARATAGSSPSASAGSSPSGGAATSTTRAGSAASSTSTAGGSTTQAPTTSTIAATTTTAPPTTVAATTTAAPAELAPTYSTLPDGSPAPIIAVFNTDGVTLTGAVPDEASKEKLGGLAKANSKFDVPVNNLLTSDPTVPTGIGVRVVELTSARFPTGSSKISGAHAAELDRVVTVMNALPNVTALVIGHSDQVGNSASNFQLSADRAAAVVNYMVFNGISPERLSSRAVGDTDLLTLNDDAASLALNRRTEFVLYGLLSA